MIFLKFILVIFVAFSNGSSLCSGADRDEDFEKSFYTFHCVGHYYNACIRNGSRDPDRTISHNGPAFEYSIKFLFTQRIQHESFSSAYGLLNRLEETKYSSSVEAIIKNAYNIAFDNFKLFVNEYTRKTLDDFLENSQFLKSYNLVEAYCNIPSNVLVKIDGSDTWHNEIRNRATSQVQRLGRKSKFLEQLDPDLAEQEAAQARRLIESFPAGHALRGHLQQQFEAARASVVFPAAPELAVLEVQRGLADRLIDQNQ